MARRASASRRRWWSPPRSLPRCARLPVATCDGLPSSPTIWWACERAGHGLHSRTRRRRGKAGRRCPRHARHPDPDDRCAGPDRRPQRRRHQPGVVPVALRGGTLLRQHAPPVRNRRARPQAERGAALPRAAADRALFLLDLPRNVMTTVEEALEGTTPLAQKVRARGPYRSTAELVAQMRAILPALTEQEKVETLNAHPRIGEDPASLSSRSLQEQGGDSLPELERLNADYERRFGFRFVVFVNRRPKSEIVEVLRRRLGRSRAEEMEEGLHAIVDIAADRLRS